MVCWIAYVIAFIFVLASTNDVTAAFAAPFFLFLVFWPVLLVVDLIVTLIRAIVKK